MLGTCLVTSYRHNHYKQRSLSASGAARSKTFRTSSAWLEATNWPHKFTPHLELRTIIPLRWGLSWLVFIPEWIAKVGRCIGCIGKIDCAKTSTYKVTGYGSVAVLYLILKGHWRAHNLPCTNLHLIIVPRTRTRTRTRTWSLHPAPVPAPNHRTYLRTPYLYLCVAAR